MDRFRSMNPDDELTSVPDATLHFTDYDLFLVMKGLDLYAYSLILSDSPKELSEVRKIALKILKVLPKPELNS